MAINWLVAPSGVLYTEPRQFTIEVLQNGLFRLYHYGPGMSSVHPTMDAAQQAAIDSGAMGSRSRCG